METLKPYTLNFAPSEMARAERVARKIPEFESKKSPLIRTALREYLDRKESELNDRAEQDNDREAA